MERLGTTRSATQAILTTESLGFFETAQAMRDVLGETIRDEKQNFAKRNSKPATTTLVRFARFRRRFQPFG